MSNGDTFPLPWERLLWAAPPAFPASVIHPRTTYAFTDFRLVVRRHNRTIQELPLHELDSVRLTQNWWQRLRGTSTVYAISGRDGSVCELAHIQHGPQLALILQLLVTDLLGDDSKEIDPEFVRKALAPGSASVLRPRQGILLAATLAFALTFAGVGLARHEPPPPVQFAADDPISPNGTRRSTEDIALFMERDVMPFARRVLAPLVGGASEVRCETCHGADAANRRWQMPGVRALPQPAVRFAGLERARLWIDPQMRNAVYGYLAQEDNQSAAAYMRHVVMPGMATVMRRPAYDFAQSYGHNRGRAAIGCYHCHLVE